MAKRKKGIGALSVMNTGAEMLAEGVGGIAGSYVSKIGTYSPVLPNQAGALASIIVGGVIKVMTKSGLGNNFGGGFVAIGFVELAKSFGIGGAEIINGTIDANQEAKMIADYKRSKGIGERVINGAVINGFTTDNAVPSDAMMHQ